MLHLDTPCEKIGFETGKDNAVSCIQIATEDFHWQIYASPKGPKLRESKGQKQAPLLREEIELCELQKTLSISIFSPKEKEYAHLNPEAITRVANLAIYIQEGAWTLAALHLVACKCTQCPRLAELFRELIPWETRQALWASALLTTRDIKNNGKALDLWCLGEARLQREVEAKKIIQLTNTFYTSISGSHLLWEYKMEMEEALEKKLIFPGQKFALAPDNYYNARKITAFSPRGKIGNLPHHLTKALTPCLAKGEVFYGEVVRILGSWRNNDDRLAIKVYRMPANTS